MRGTPVTRPSRLQAAKEFRTSSQYFLPTTRDPTLEKIDRRVSWLTRIPISHAEYIQARGNLGQSRAISRNLGDSRAVSSASGGAALSDFAVAYERVSE